MKRVGIILVSTILVTSLITGFSRADLSAKQYFSNYVEKSQELTSLSYDADFNLELNFDNFDVKKIVESQREAIDAESTTTDDLDTEMIDKQKIAQTSKMLKALSKYKFSFSGKQVTEPLQAEMEMSMGTDFQGINYTVDMPVIIKDDKMYMQLPELLSAFMPDPTKEYLSMDLNIDGVNTKAVQEKSLEFNKKVMNSIDESLFKYEDPKGYKTKELKPYKVVSMNIKQDDVRPLLNTMINEWFPEAIKLVEQTNPTVDKESLDLIEQQLATNDALIQAGLDELNKHFAINNFKVTNLFDKNDYPRKIIYDIDIVLKAEEFGELGVTLKGEYNFNNINKKLNFEMEVPSADKVMSIEELQQQMEPELEVTEQTTNEEVVPQTTTN